MKTKDGFQLGMDTADSKIRKLVEMPHVIYGHDPLPGEELAYGVVIDCETTGLDKENDEIISLGWIKFSFNDKMEIIEVVDSGHLFNEPRSGEIPEKVTQLTGIAFEQVEGHHISDEDFNKIFNGIDIAIAHNAKFDRFFIDRYTDKKIVWGCTNDDLNLKERFFIPTNSLGIVVAYMFDYYFGHHDALEDCWAALHVLNYEGFLEEILTKAYTPVKKIYATNSAFQLKDTLKSRGYKWDMDAKCWYIVSDSDEKRIEEEDFLSDYNVTPEIYEVSVFDRFR